MPFCWNIYASNRRQAEQLKCSSTRWHLNSAPHFCMVVSHTIFPPSCEICAWAQKWLRNSSNTRLRMQPMPLSEPCLTWCYGAGECGQQPKQQMSKVHLQASVSNLQSVIFLFFFLPWHSKQLLLQHWSSLATAGWFQASEITPKQTFPSLPERFVSIIINISIVTGLEEPTSRQYHLDPPIISHTRRLSDWTLSAHKERVALTQ